MLPPGSVPLAHPSLGDARLLVLPHPHSGVPSYYALHGTPSELYEVLVVRPAAPHARSWFLTHADATSASRAPGAVLGDGALRTLSPVDPALVALGMLADTEARHFCPLEDLAEAAAELHAQRRAEALPGRAQPWPDIVPFLMLPAMEPHLQRICDTQSEAAASGLVYRLSWDKIAALLDAKHARLAHPDVHAAAPETLGRLVRKSLDQPQTASDEEVRKAQAHVARSLLLSYVPRSVAERWTSSV